MTKDSRRQIISTHWISIGEATGWTHRQVGHTGGSYRHNKAEEVNNMSHREQWLPQ